jgi:hypothetical protein
MRVVDLGHGEVAIEPESAADAAGSLSIDKLKQSRVSDEAIKIYQRYVERLTSGSASQ